MQARRQQRAWTPHPATHGSRPRHLLSGLMLCAEGGGRFVIKHHRRGVHEALASATIPADDLRKKREAELAQARKEQENIEAAIRQGIITPTTKRMLLETEARIAHLEAALRAEPNRKVAFLPSAVEMCLRDLRGTLGTDPDYARGLLAKLIDSITLRKEGARLFADVRGNITGLLGLDAEYDNRGAGRAFLFERHARVRIA